jgi:cyclin-dependent kinase 12/13
MYDIIAKIGEGMYGHVYKAKEKKSAQIVALKKIRLESSQQGFPITAIREVKILRNLKHPNIVCLKDVICSADTTESITENWNKYGNLEFYLVFEYLEHDLSGILVESGEIEFDINLVRSYTRQLLSGVKYCHDHNILHRDIKGL